ncbi:MAG: TonB-dependent receptor [Bacteroidales bacterium]
MRQLILILMISLISPLASLAQSTLTISGNVINSSERTPIEFVTVQIEGSALAAMTDENGNFTITDVKPGIYTLTATSLGLKPYVSSQYIVSTRDISVDIEMERAPTELSTLVVNAPNFRRENASPIGLRVIGIQEIEKSPGANRDISRIVQSYPGVAFSPAGYRNDLIVRGGGPSENRFYLDGIEIPNINHFSTQGASGGPVGIINADLIREVKFYTGGFPADKGNALSSVLDFKLRDGNMASNSIKATLGTSEASLTANGHLGDKTTYLVSLRQSYLQVLFKLLGLPFLPTYTDGQFKVKTKFNKSNELTVLGLVGIDDMELNNDISSESSEYLLSYLPTIKQETFTIGAVYKHYSGNNSQRYYVSHSYLNNKFIKYQENDQSSIDNLTLDYKSREQETKFRFENITTLTSWKITAGANIDLPHYSNNTYQRIYLDSLTDLNYETELNLFKWGVFTTATYCSPDNRFTANLGLRTDANSYSSKMSNPIPQISPRVALDYELLKSLHISGNIGVFYQLPPYTGLGYKDNSGEYINKELDYMQVIQQSLGVNWQSDNMIELSLEGFYKRYNNVPLSVADDIPLTCKGDDYGVLGAEELVSSAQGQSYGIELLARWIIIEKLNLSSSLTLYKSEYRSSSNADYIDSAWDNQFIFNISGTYNLPKNWSVGAKLRAIGGAPYTPYDVEKSSLVEAWDASGAAYYDYNQYNTLRSDSFYQLDIRVDKNFYIGRAMLGVYIDIQNVTASKYSQPDILMSTGAIENPEAPKNEQHYIMKYISNSSGTIIPSIGITFEY